MERIRERNSSDQEQPLEDKDKDPATEVGLRAGGIFEEIPFRLMASLQAQVLYPEVPC